MYYVYVIRSQFLNKTYIGYTEDLDRRLTEHNSRFKKMAENGFDWELIHVEEYPTKSLAMKREKYFKTGDGRRVLKLKGVR